MDPDILRDLELRLLPPIELRLRWMGLILPPFDRSRQDQELALTAFATRLYHGPWAQVVRRRTLAREQRERQQENLLLFWNVQISNRETFFRDHPNAADDLWR